MLSLGVRLMRRLPFSAKFALIGFFAAMPVLVVLQRVPGGL
jgi:hypothetical protein